MHQHIISQFSCKISCLSAFVVVLFDKVALSSQETVLSKREAAPSTSQVAPSIYEILILLSIREGRNMYST